MKIRNVYLIIACVICTGVVFGQNSNLANQIARPDRYAASEVIDPIYGITQYEKLNMRLKWDSIRNCKGYACSGWVKDYYDDGQLLHKGYYIEGQLKLYTNYYPNGKIERTFRVVDDYKSTMGLFFETGVVKSKINYVEQDAIKWEDFYETGQVMYIEEYHRSFEYYLMQNTYFEDGSPKEIFELENKKKLIFIKKSYHKNGQVSREGEVKYSKESMDYINLGTFKSYDEKGKLTKEEEFIDGILHEEKAH